MHQMIREAHLSDLPVIESLARETWPVAYQSVIPTGQITYMLSLMYSQAALHDQFLQGHLFFILYDADEALGFASISELIPPVFRLHKLYVLPIKQGLGLGQILLRHAEKASLKAGADTLELNVNKRNPALSFYLKHGFAVFREETIDIGEGYVMDDFVLRKKLI